MRITRLLGVSATPAFRLDSATIFAWLLGSAAALAAPVVLDLHAESVPNGAGQAAELESVDGESGAFCRVSDWGEEHDGLQTRLVLLTARAAVGQGIRLRFEIRNTSDTERKFDPQFAAPYHVLRAIRPDGEPDESIGPTYQTAGQPHSIQPGETKVLWDDFDIASQYMLAKPGRYTMSTAFAEYTFRGLPGQPGERVSDIPASGVLTIDVEPGTLAGLKGTFLRMRQIAPKDWRTSLSGMAMSFIHSPTGLKKDVSTIQLWFEEKEHPAGYALGEEPNEVPVESLGKASLGFAYLTVSGRVAELWPEYRKAIQERLQHGTNANAADQNEIRFDGAELHVVGCYGSGPNFARKRVDVDVPALDKPIVLAVTAYHAVNWHIKIAEPARIRAVIVAGYFEQSVQGIPAEIPVILRTYFPAESAPGKIRSDRRFFWAYDPNSTVFQETVNGLHEITGLAMHSFQGSYYGTSFVVDGVRGRGVGSAIRPPSDSKSREATNSPATATATEEKTRPAQVLVLKREQETVKSAQVVAPTHGRQPDEVWKKVLETEQLRGNNAPGRPGEWLTDQETIVSGSATHDGSSLQARDFLLSLPEGSALRAEFSGDSVEFRHESNKTHIKVHGGSVRLIDPSGVARATATPTIPNAVLEVEAWMNGGGEVVLHVLASRPHRAVPVRVELDSATGVPAEEKQPPHGSVRYRIIPRDQSDKRPTQFKMQWIYELEKLRREAEGNEKPAGTGPKSAPGEKPKSIQPARSARSQASPRLSSPTSVPAEQPKSTSDAVAAPDHPDSILVVRLFSNKNGEWTGLRIGDDSKSPKIERLEQGLRDLGPGRKANLRIRIEADERLPYEIVRQVTEAAQRHGLQQIEFKKLPTPRGEGNSSVLVRTLDASGQETDAVYVNLWLKVQASDEVQGERWHDGEHVWERMRNWSPHYPKPEGGIQFTDIAAGDYRVTAVYHGPTRESGPAPFGATGSFQVVEGKQTEATVRLGSGDPLVVRVLDAKTSQPIEHVPLRLFGRDGMPIVGAQHGNGNFFDRTNSRGEVRYEAVPAGEYSIDVSGKRARAAWEAPIDWPGLEGQQRISVASGRVNTVEFRLEPKPLDETELDRRWPWSVRGVVTDGDGKPLEGVELRAHTGMGTLMLTGQTTTGRDGRYVLRFGPGIAISRNGRPAVGLQAATISASKPGYFEKDLGRHGNLAMTDDAELAKDAKDFAAVVLPNQPKELVFVMQSSARATGTLLDAQGKPLAGYRISLTGSELPPSSSALASGGKTDEKGRFEFRDIPRGYHFQILVEPPVAEPPWIAWASGPLDFADPGKNDLAVRSGKLEFTAKVFELQLVSTGENWRQALAGAAAKEPIDIRGEARRQLGDAEEGRVEAARLRLALGAQ
jgi:biopolymer transport protein ExbD